LPKPEKSIAERRLNLWRKSILLFDALKKHNYIGPFKRAEYGYYLEGKSQEGLTPDIFGISHSYYAICDISMSPQKGHDMGKYTDCLPSEYIQKTVFPREDGLEPRSAAGAPFLITDATDLEKVLGYNLVQVFQPGNLFIEQINDEVLKTAFEGWTGIHFPPPSYSLLALPESDKEELKKSIAALLKWAAVFSEPISIEAIIQKLLGDLYTSISKSGRAQLRKNVQSILYDLSKGKLSEYLTITNDNININIDTTKPQSRKAFSDRLNDWLEIVPIEIILADKELLGEVDDDID